MQVFDGKRHFYRDVPHLRCILTHTTDGLNYFINGINFPVITKLPVPEVKNKLLCYLTKIEELIIRAMTTTMLLLEKLCELIDVTNSILPGTDSYLTRIVSFNETLFCELNEIDAIIFPKNFIIT